VGTLDRYLGRNTLELDASRLRTLMGGVGTGGSISNASYVGRREGAHIGLFRELNDAGAEVIECRFIDHDGGVVASFGMTLDVTNTKWLALGYAGCGQLILAASTEATGSAEQPRSVYLRHAITSITADYSATENDAVILADATSGGITITLPVAVGMAGKALTVKKLDATANTVTVDGAASETIDGAATHVLSSQYDVVRIVCDGTGWWVI
jgi:hypothetical protein